MRSEHQVQHVAIADYFRVKGDAKSLGMTGCTSADLLISGISLVPANVAAFHRQYAFQRIEHRFSAPEASACQSGNFLSHIPAFAAMSIRIDRATGHRLPKMTKPFHSHRHLHAPTSTALSCYVLHQ